jgi:hypothetical protein
MLTLQAHAAFACGQLARQAGWEQHPCRKQLTGQLWGGGMGWLRPQYALLLLKVSLCHHQAQQASTHNYMAALDFGIAAALQVPVPYWRHEWVSHTDLLSYRSMCCSHGCRQQVCQHVC